MTQPRRRGRPALVEGELSQPASTNLPPEVYDAVCRIAAQRGVSVARVLRHAVVRLVKVLKDESGGAVHL